MGLVHDICGGLIEASASSTRLGNSIIKPSLSIMRGHQTSLSIMMGVMRSLSIMQVQWNKFVMGVLEVPCQISR